MMNVRLCFAFLVFFVVFSPSSLLAQSPPLLAWKPFGNLREARHLFGALAVSPTQALVMGGYTRSTCVLCGVPTRTCELLDVETRTITDAPPMNAAHAEAVFLHTRDSNIVAVSGVSDGGSLTPLCELYDRTTRSWRQLGNLLTARRQHTAVFINDEELLVVGGLDASISSLASAEIFNVRTGQSRRVADFPYAINLGVMGISQNGRAIVFSGRSGGGDSFRTTTVYGYNVGRNTWEAQGSYFEAVHIPQLLHSFKNELIVSGGTKREAVTPIESITHVGIEVAGGFQQIGTMALL